MKKLTIIGLIFAGLGIVAGSGWLFFAGQKEPPKEIVSGSPFGEGGEAAETPEQARGAAVGGGILRGADDGVSGSEVFQIHAKPVAGAGFVNKDEGVFARYMERGLGHIFETNMETKRGAKILNETRLKIHDAFWGNNGANAAFRYLDEESGVVRTFSISLTETRDEESGELRVSSRGEFLPDNIGGIAVSEADSRKIFYLLNTGGSGAGTVYNMETGAKAQIFSSPLTEWIPGWPARDTVTLTTKASFSVPGMMYALSVRTERLSKVLDGIPGLTTLTSPDTRKTAYSHIGPEGFFLMLLNENTGKKTPLSVVTLPEKCVWGGDSVMLYCSVPDRIPSATYPDDWYKGIVSFSDSLWEINTETFEANILADFETQRIGDIDGINLQISDDGAWLIFQNKRDMSLWGARL